MDFHALKQDQTLLVQIHIFSRLFLTLSYYLTLSEFRSRFLNSIELLNSCKHFIRLTSLSSVHLKRACEVAWDLSLRSIKFSSCFGKNVDYMENLKFSSRFEISSRVR